MKNGPGAAGHRLGKGGGDEVIRGAPSERIILNCPVVKSVFGAEACSLLAVSQPAETIPATGL